LRSEGFFLATRTSPDARKDAREITLYGKGGHQRRGFDAIAGIFDSDHNL
jgi:hypothetical protein